MILKKMNTNNKGFSLVELMIVVAIIGLLAAIGVPQYAKFQARARQSEAKGALGALYSAQQAFFQEWNKYSVDLRNIGFGVTGQNLRYVTGFNPGAICTGYAAAGNPGAPAEVTTPSNTLSNAGAPGAMGTLYPDLNSRPSFSAAPINFQTKAAVTPPTLAQAPGGECNNTFAGGPVFVATSEGDPKNTPTVLTADRWIINQAKLMSNTASGL